MARVITPSGDQVRTVYSSGGFAAGDYVFQTASGFEKAQGVTPWPIKTSATWIGGAVSNLGMGFSSSADNLLGPSQVGGIYSGAAITSGSTTLSTKSFSVTDSQAQVVRLSSGNWMVATNRTTGVDWIIKIYEPTFTTVIQTITGTDGYTFYYYRLVPDNSGGAFFLGSPGNYVYGFYIAETSANVYAISNIVNDAGTAGYALSVNTANLISDGLVSIWGSSGGGGGTSGQAKFSYTPRSTATPTVFSSSTGGGNCNLTNNGGGAVFFDRGVYNPGSLGVKTSGLFYWAGASLQFVWIYDFAPTNPVGTSYGFNSYGPGAVSYNYGVPTVRRSGGVGTLIVPCISTGTANIILFQASLNTSGNIYSAFFTGNITNASNTYSSLLNTAIYPITNPLNDDCDLLLTYSRINAGTITNGARIITGALANGVAPTASAEIVLSTSTTGISGLPTNYWDRFSNNVLGYAPTSSTVGTVTGVAGAALSSPQPFVYGSSLAPVQTGTCVGVALTAASAGGTGKILTRGTAEVRSTLPNMPGALSFNHANYGTPGGIRGSVAGRTVTFEGIDG